MTSVAKLSFTGFIHYFSLFTYASERKNQEKVLFFLIVLFIVLVLFSQEQLFPEITFIFNPCPFPSLYCKMHE